MRTCLFCGEELEVGKVHHNSGECKDKISKINNYLEKDDRITVGVATCGLAAGAKKSLDVLKSSKLSMPVDEVGCSGMCFNEPIVSVRHAGKTYIYGEATEDKIRDIIKTIKDGTKHDDCFLGEKLEDIEFFKKQKRVLMSNCGLVSPLVVEHYIAREGYKGLMHAVELNSSEIIAEIKKSGLRGRGGAGFPTHMKWEIFSKSSGDKYLVVNGDEGDPGAFMNRTLIESDPFRILEGFAIASRATGAKKGIIYTRAEYPLAVETLEKAICICEEHNLLGKDILGIKGFDFDVEVKTGAGAFVCGEETSLMKSVEGKRGHPMPRPPYPAQKGIFGHPTNINNVETYAHVANVLRYGSSFYEKIGVEKNHGTKAICLAGKVLRAGVAEVPLGITLREVVYDIGGGLKNGKKFKAVQLGGPSGGCIPEQFLDTTLDFDSVPKLGAIMGSGGVIVLDEDDSMVDVARFFLTFTTSESCGKCVPCREGTKRMLEIVDRISKGMGKHHEIELLKRLAKVVQDSSLCGLGKSAPNPVLTTLKYFGKEYEEALGQKKPNTFMITDRCIGCGLCKRNCPVKAISGSPKAKHHIDQETCVHCGKCHNVCPVNSIDIL